MWPPDEATVIGVLGASLGGLVLTYWRKHERRIEALENSMGSVAHREEQEAQADRLEATITGLRADVKEGFSEGRAANKELRDELQRRTELLMGRQSEMNREVHAKIEATARDLRGELDRVRGGRRNTDAD